MQILSTVLEAAASLPLDIPDVGQGTAPPGSEGLETILGWVKWLAFGICIVSLMVAGAMLGFGGRSGEGGEHAGRIGRALAGVIVVSAAVSMVGFLAS